MPRNVVNAEDYVYDRVSYRAYISSGSTNKGERRKMKTILKKAILTELTDVQRYCLIEYYVNQRKMKDIASELSLHPSTVTRHIKRAKEKLCHIAGYYQ